MQQELIDRYKDETGDLLLLEQDKFYEYIQKNLDEQNKDTGDILFEGNPVILKNVIMMHRTVIGDDTKQNLIHFMPSGIEQISMDVESTHVLKTFIPQKSYLSYKIGNSIQSDGGWIDLSYKNILDFCSLGAKDDHFHYRYDSSLNDFYIKFGCLTRRFGGYDAKDYSKIQIPALDLGCNFKINLNKLLKVVILAEKVGIEILQTEINQDYLHIFGEEYFDDDGKDELTEMIEIEDWNYIESTSTFATALLKRAVTLLSKHYKIAEFHAGNYLPMKITAGTIIGEKDDDLFQSEILIAPRVKEIKQEGHHDYEDEEEEYSDEDDDEDED